MPETSASYLAAATRVCKRWGFLTYHADSHILNDCNTNELLPYKLAQAQYMHKVTIVSRQQANFAIRAVATSCTRLRTLQVHSPQLDDLLLFLARPQSWRECFFSCISVPPTADLAPLAGLVHLKRLFLSLPVASLSPLSNLAELEYLRVQGTSGPLSLAPLQVVGFVCLLVYSVSLLLSDWIFFSSNGNAIGDHKHEIRI
eukprot:gnl/Hemi2/5281_TR1826_c0_g2_i1.p1 gnl/Hemi2/5281_TR1826_c0_g2~~gnl/Hemi2/5281_TR1826_c0_g2_i1.p1  ORF type:complete len:201 (+),score=0.78 gnl/Hemi2/5281_TR1826_c0_g2_i1:277-879(+)